MQGHLRPIYFTLHGETQFEYEDKIGGDSDLTEKGNIYCEMLEKFFNEEFQYLSKNDDDFYKVIIL